MTLATARSDAEYESFNRFCQVAAIYTPMYTWFLRANMSLPQFDENKFTCLGVKSQLVASSKNAAAADITYTVLCSNLCCILDHVMIGI